MTTNVDNLEDLEAMLAGLDDLDEADLAELEGLDEAELDEVAVTPSAHVVAEAEESLDDLDAELADLDVEEPAPVSVVEDIEAELAGIEAELETPASEPVKPTRKPRGRRATLPALDPTPAVAAEPVEATQEDTPFSSEEEALFNELDSGVVEETLAAAEPAPIAANPSTLQTPVYKPVNKLKTFIDPDRVQEDLNFTVTSLSTAMTRQAALFAHYSTLAAQVQFQADRCKQQIDLLHATLDEQYRNAFITAGTKVTEAVIEAAITKDETYQAALLKSNEAKLISKTVDAVADSFRHKRDMLIQIGADLREEKKGSPVVREHPGAAAVAALSGTAR